MHANSNFEIITSSAQSDIFISIEENLKVHEISDRFLREDEGTFDNNDVSSSIILSFLGSLFLDHIVDRSNEGLLVN